MINGNFFDSVTLPTGFILSNRYEIQRCLGRGGMGTVYLAHDRLLGWNQVAIKILHRELARSEKVVKRFLREVQLMHLVNHPNVVRTFDVGVQNEYVYFTMEYVPGVSLDECEYEGIIGYEQLGELTIQICGGLGAIHEARIVHRDLKPGNIMLLEDNRLKIADFGVARPVSSEITQHQEIVGSINYMAPEVMQGQDLTPAVDFYSLGVILYELVTGHLPFDAQHSVSMMWMHINKRPEPPIRHQSNMPAWLNDLILCMLAKTPKDRPATAQEIVAFVRRNSAPSGPAAPEQEAAEPLEMARDFEPEAPLPEDRLDSDIPGMDDSGLSESGLFHGATDSGTMRSANSGIIFRSFPTQEEIDEHTESAMHRRKIAEPAPEEEFPDLGDDDGAMIRELRRLYRALLGVFVIVVLALVGLGWYVLKSKRDDGMRAITSLLQTTPRQSLPAPGSNPLSTPAPSSVTPPAVTDDFALLQSLLNAAAASGSDEQQGERSAAKMIAVLDS